ncbi:hypothetical protein OROMI_008572 [Orobanche minor]
MGFLHPDLGVGQRFEARYISTYNYIIGRSAIGEGMTRRDHSDVSNEVDNRSLFQKINSNFLVMKKSIYISGVCNFFALQYFYEHSSITEKSIYISERSPRGVFKAYLREFKKDFSLFLKSRSEKIVGGITCGYGFMGNTLPNSGDSRFSVDNCRPQPI